MRLLAYLVIAASLIVGVVGAVTAYLPRVDTDSAPERLAGLRLNAPAGDSGTTSIAGDPEPLVADEATLTEQSVRDLRAADVKRVRVREFAWERWTGRWLFAVGCAGLLAAGLFLRRQGSRRAAAGAFGASAGQEDPTEILARLRDDVAGILREGPQQAVRENEPVGYYRPGMVELIVDRVGDLQRTLMPAFIAARPKLIATFGMAGYARLMDPYAAAERALNRAWSAAADNDEEEAITSLRRALSLLEEASRRLPE